MSTEAFKASAREEKIHFAKCAECGGMMDRRRLSEVIFHTTHEGPEPELDPSEGAGVMVRGPDTCFAEWKEQFGVQTLQASGVWIAEMDPDDAISAGSHIGDSEHEACMALAEAESLPEVPDPSTDLLREMENRARDERREAFLSEMRAILDRFHVTVWQIHEARATSFAVRSEAFDVNLDELWELTQEGNATIVATGRKGAFCNQWKELLTKYGVILVRDENQADEGGEFWISYQLASDDAFVALRDVALPR